MRRALYQSRRHENGCPKSGWCALHKRLGKEVPCGPAAVCKNLITPVEEAPDPAFNRRLGYLNKLESMVNVGCKFAPNDLEPGTWNELIWLAIERQRLDEKIRKARDQKDDKQAQPPEEKKALQAARKELGVPEAGTSLFPRKVPIR